MADAGPATVALNIIASASKAKSLFFNACLLRYGTLIIGIVSGMSTGCILPLIYFRFASACKGTEAAQRLPSIDSGSMLDGQR